jgi:hypothetical protein
LLIRGILCYRTVTVRCCSSQAARHGYPEFSSAETVLEPGNRYLVAVEAAVNDEVMNLLRG